MNQVRVCTNGNHRLIFAEEFDPQLDQSPCCPACKTPVNTFSKPFSKPCKCGFVGFTQRPSCWHRIWTRSFPIRDLILNHEAPSRLTKVADAVILDPPTILEFQSSYVSSQALSAKERAVSKCGYELIWIVDCTGLPFVPLKNGCFCIQIPTFAQPIVENAIFDVGVELLMFEKPLTNRSFICAKRADEFLELLSRQNIPIPSRARSRVQLLPTQILQRANSLETWRKCTDCDTEIPDDAPVWKTRCLSCWKKKNKG
jgi:hypothetical protein